jgi:hypothetical protein|tara:strand:- start:56 stop:298 length:243 start_codon:yes stop_codon:yes gene_type:complete
MNVDLGIGDIVVDLVSGTAGILVFRYLLTNGGPESPFALWAWDVYWVGKEIIPDSRLQTWTEYGLTNIIKAGTFVHYKDV